MDAIKEFLSIPIVQVVLGAVISAVVSLLTTRATMRHQVLGMRIEAHATTLEKIREVLGQFEPIEFTVTKGVIGQKVSAVQHYENYRRLFFQNASLLPIPVREALYGHYHIAELAYLYLHAPGEQHADLRKAAKTYLEAQGSKIDFLRAEDTEALHRVITLFAAEFRQGLTDVSDVLTASVQLER